MSIPSLIFGLLISTTLALTFHLLRGGRVARMFLYVITAWISFPVGHFVGGWIGVSSLRLGDLNLLPAVLATILSLLLASILAAPNKRATGRPKPGKGRWD